MLKILSTIPFMIPFYVLTVLPSFGRSDSLKQELPSCIIKNADPSFLATVERFQNSESSPKAHKEPSASPTSRKLKYSRDELIKLSPKEKENLSTLGSESSTS